MSPFRQTRIFNEGDKAKRDLPMVNATSNYKHCYSPDAGIVTSEPSIKLSDDMATNIQGMVVKNGEISSDYGTTQFPVPSTTKTNKLNGSVMRVDHHVKTDATSFLVALTTTHAYEFNTSTGTWDNISKGQTIEDCEDAWTANANVTATADGTIKLRGTNSSKLVIASAFITGVAAYEDFGSKDLHSETGVHFWIYSTVATSAGDLRLLLDDTSGCVSPLENLQIPALTANTWTPVSIDYADPSLLTAIISVGLKVQVDLGAMTVYLDDVRSTQRFTGDEDDRFSVDLMNNIATITQGIDRVFQYDFVAATGLTTPTLSLNTGALTSSEIVVALKDHLLFFNNIENAATASQRCSWTNIGSTTDLINGTAGYQDLTGDNYVVVSVKKMGENRAILYKERSIVICEWVGGQTPFRFTTVVEEQGALSKDSVADKAGVHIVMGFDFIYKYAGGSSIERVDDENHTLIYNSINRTYVSRIFMIYDKPNNELQFWLPTLTAYPDDVWCVEFLKGAWYRKSRTMTGFGPYISQVTKTIGDLVGTIGEQNYRIGDNTVRSNTPILLLGDYNGNMYQIDSSSLNNNGVAITNEFQSKDFLPNIQDITLSFRVDKFLLDVKGQSVTVDFSTDSGNSWSPAGGNSSNTRAITGNYEMYEFDFDVVCRKIRFRLRNTSLSSGFTFNYFGFKNKMRSSRK